MSYATGFEVGALGQSDSHPSSCYALAHLRDGWARLFEQVGVKRRCLEQFNSASREAHHRVTLWFLDPAHPDSLRSDFDQVRADGGGMSPRLQAAVETLTLVPLDDCVCEGPHAQAKRLKMPASSAKWPWVASSMRLKQNIAMCRELPQQTNASLRVVWTSWGTVVQSARKSKRFPKMKPMEMRRLLYRLDHLQGFSVGAAGVALGPLALPEHPHQDNAMANGDEDQGHAPGFLGQAH